jgi:cytochrome c-type biogenesis protein CcmH/NrfF
MTWVWWVALVVVVGVALGVGATRRGPPASAAQRVNAIDALVRCPSCQGISVADSSASTAVAIRRAVAARVAARQTDAQIDAFLVSRYGPGILLRPPVHGSTAWVWVLPPAAAVLAVGGLVSVLWRRRRRPSVTVSAAERALVEQALTGRAAVAGRGAEEVRAPVARPELDDERSFLLDSLEDLERERYAGDLSDVDYALLRDRYTHRAAEVLRALSREPSAEQPSAEQPSAEQPSADQPSSVEQSSGAVAPEDAASPRRRRRVVLVVGSMALVAAVAVALVASQIGTRLPGQTVTGSVSLSRSAQLHRTLAQAETLETAGNAAGALRLYHQVLVQDSNQPEALAESGWLEFQAGVQARDAGVLASAQQLELQAQRAEPGAYAPHLYLGSMLLAEGDASGAVTQYRQFLSDGPPQSVAHAAQPYITEAFHKAGLPVPSMPGSAPAG